MDVNLIIVALYSYIFGSIPFGLILTNLFLKKDIRKVGSGNIGTTNVLRTGNKFLAILTLAFDLFKGYVSVYVTMLYYSDLVSYAALICFIGHIFPIWLKFKGGKGVATYLGVILAFSYDFFLVFGVSWLTLSFLFRYASLSSILSSLIILLYAYFFENNNYSFILFIFFVIILFTHKENIVRLKKSEENKIKL